MSVPKPPRVTFDTNICNLIENPDRWPNQVNPADARKVRNAVQDGGISGFISEATLFIECLSFEDKLTYLAVVGTEGARPVPDPRAVARFKVVEEAGARLLHAPIIAAEIFIEGFNWASDEVFSGAERNSRFSNFCRPLGGRTKLKQSGNALDQQFPTLFHGTKMKGPASWMSAFRRAWDADPAGRKKLRSEVSPLIGEWCDGLMVGSHFAYGNDVFCTIDCGKNAGAGSILHHSNRTALQTQGINVMTPVQLVQHLQL